MLGPEPAIDASKHSLKARRSVRRHSPRGPPEVGTRKALNGRFIWRVIVSARYRLCALSSPRKAGASSRPLSQIHQLNATPNYRVFDELT